MVGSINPSGTENNIQKSVLGGESMVTTPRSIPGASRFTFPTDRASLGRLELTPIAAALCAILVGVGTEGAAFGQEPTEKLEEVLVTGSRIVRRDFDAPSPIITVGTEVFQQNSSVAIEAVLNQYPQFNPGATQFTTGEIQPTATTSPGASTLNMRGLGANRSLVLLDGRRAQPVNAAMTVDVNTLPAAAIADVEVISGGAAATYGPDAMAGVVNFKLRKDFEGIDINYQTGFTDAGDGEESRFDVLIGGNFGDDDRGNAMVSVGYANREAAWQMNRDFFVEGFNDPGTPANYPRIDYPYYTPAAGNLPSQAAVNQVSRHYHQSIAYRRLLQQSARRHRVPAAKRARLYRATDFSLQDPHPQQQLGGGQPALVCVDAADALLLVRPRELRAVGQLVRVRAGHVRDDRGRHRAVPDAADRRRRSARHRHLRALGRRPGQHADGLSTGRVERPQLRADGRVHELASVARARGAWHAARFTHESQRGLDPEPHRLLVPESCVVERDEARRVHRRTRRQDRRHRLDVGGLHVVRPDGSSDGHEELRVDRPLPESRTAAELRHGWRLHGAGREQHQYPRLHVHVGSAALRAVDSRRPRRGAVLQRLPNLGRLPRQPSPRA